MAEKIKKIKFKENAGLQIEIVPLNALTIGKHKEIKTPHRTNFYHIFLVDDCQPTHIIDFEPTTIQPYSMLFIDKDRVHQFDQFQEYKGQLLVFTEDFFCTTEMDIPFLRSSILFNDLAGKSLIPLTHPEYEKYVRLFKEITDELYLHADNLKPTLLKNLLHNLLLLAEREKRKQGFTELKKGADLDYTLLFRDLLEKHYIQRKSVSDYVKRMFISEKRLGQATAKVLGKSPKEIINDKIVLESKRLLVHTNLSIKEIGQELGFEDPAYFVRFFKKNTETTPVEFRASYLDK
jgi:AraC family transcriptional activator of pobA